MNPTDPNQPSYAVAPNPAYPESADTLPPSPIHNPLSVMQPGEQTICEIKRHPIGLFAVYAMSGLLLVLLAIVVFGVAPNFITTISRSQVIELGGILFFVVAMLAFGFVFVANKIYWGNRWILTSDSITQVSQKSLFDRQTSQLSLGNLEDVTVEQNGPLQQLYNFGLLRCETAGQRSKFVFPYCPRPNEYAKKILEAREHFEQGRRGEDEQRLYREQEAYPQPPTRYDQYGQPQPTQNPAYPYPQSLTNPVPPYYKGGNPDDHGVNLNTE